jgi:hypothetical protein
MLRNYLATTALVLGLMVTVVVGAYVYWSFVGEASPAGVAEAAPSQAQGSEGQPPEAGASANTGAEPIDSVFVHRATSESVSSNSTYLDNRLINGNPNAILSVTQYWNPESGDGAYNDHSVGVWYDEAAERWAIFNQDRAPMPEGVAFNVVVAAAASGTR